MDNRCFFKVLMIAAVLIAVSAAAAAGQGFDPYDVFGTYLSRADRSGSGAEWLETARYGLQRFRDQPGSRAMERLLEERYLSFVMSRMFQEQDDLDITLLLETLGQVNMDLLYRTAPDGSVLFDEAGDPLLRGTGNYEADLLQWKNRGKNVKEDVLTSWLVHTRTGFDELKAEQIRQFASSGYLDLFGEPSTPGGYLEYTRTMKRRASKVPDLLGEVSAVSPEAGISLEKYGRAWKDYLELEIYAGALDEAMEKQVIRVEERTLDYRNSMENIITADEDHIPERDAWIEGMRVKTDRLGQQGFSGSLDEWGLAGWYLLTSRGITEHVVNLDDEIIVKPAVLDILRDEGIDCSPEEKPSSPVSPGSPWPELLGKITQTSLPAPVPSTWKPGSWKRR